MTTLTKVAAPAYTPAVPAVAGRPASRVCPLPPCYNGVNDIPGVNCAPGPSPGGSNSPGNGTSTPPPGGGGSDPEEPGTPPVRPCTVYCAEYDIVDGQRVCIDVRVSC